MAKWEYLEVQALVDGGLGDWSINGIIYKPDGNHDMFQAKNLGQSIAKIGEAGWELVSTVHVNTFGIVISNPAIHYMFKRQIE